MVIPVPLPTRRFQAAAAVASVVLFLIATAPLANAACTPAADATPNPVSGTTVTCSGVTTNQNADAGYGTGNQIGITVNVSNGASVTGTAGSGFGIYVGNATISNGTGASILGGNTGISASSGASNVTNSGSITGTSLDGIDSFGNATVTNNAGATINGARFGIFAIAQTANVTNSGSIAGTGNDGIFAGNSSATVTNNVGGSIAGGQYGIHTTDFFNGFVIVTNSGSISGAGLNGIQAATDATVTNNAGASITGGLSGIRAVAGAANVTNSGSITGSTGDGISGNASTMVTNNAGASITGGQYGIHAFGFANNLLNVTNYGTISGGITGIFADPFPYSPAGGSSVFNAGTISGGTNAIQFTGTGNTLTLAAGSVITGNVLGTGSDTLQLGGTGAATFDVSQLGAAAQYRGFGTFNKIDASVWTLIGTSTYGGAVNVNGGTLAVNGDISAASSLTVNAGGTLGGTGIVGNTQINGGTLAPGNSIGLLTVHGNLSFTAASSYMIEVSPANADRTNVTGTATLGGATVKASWAAGSYVNKQYTIVNATGGVNGTFSSLVNTNLPGGFAAGLTYDANNAYLNIALFIAPPGGLNVNQQNVGNAVVNFFNSTGGIPIVFGGLTPAGLTQLSGEGATGSQQTTFNAMNQFLGVMTDPFVAGRGEGLPGGGTAAGYADEEALAYAQKRKPSDALAAIYTKAPQALAFTQRWSVWAAGFGGSQTTDGNATLGSNRTTSSVYGTAVGADYRFSPFTTAGFALAGGGTNFSVANVAGSGRSDLFQAGVFVRHNVGPAYITAALAYGWQDVTTDRTVTIAGFDQLRAKFNADAWSGRVEGGYRFVTQGIGLTPYAAGQFATFDLPNYAESVVAGANTFALTYAGKSVTATRSELGLRSDKSFAMQDGIFTLRGRAAWAHDYNTDRNVGATFQTLPGASFVVNGAVQARDAALTTASAEWKWLNGFSVAGTFEGEFSDVTKSYAGKGVVRYAW